MTKPVKETIHAKGLDIGVYTNDFKNEFISLTDIAKYRSDQPFILVCNWMRNRDVIEFLGLWEKLHNPNFKPIEFDRFKNEAGGNAFTMSPEKWITSTNSIGIISKRGRGGGTYAHFDRTRKYILKPRKQLTKITILPTLSHFCSIIEP